MCASTYVCVCVFVCAGLNEYAGKDAWALAQQARAAQDAKHGYLDSTHPAPCTHTPQTKPSTTCASLTHLLTPSGSPPPACRAVAGAAAAAARTCTCVCAWQGGGEQLPTLRRAMPSAALGRLWERGPVTMGIRLICALDAGSPPRCFSWYAAKWHYGSHGHRKRPQM